MTSIQFPYCVDRICDLIKGRRWRRGGCDLDLHKESVPCEDEEEGEGEGGVEPSASIVLYIERSVSKNMILT